MTTRQMTRRQALAFAGGQALPARRAALPPREQLVNTLEYEEQARRVLTPAIASLVGGGSRTAFDRITLRPRMLVPVLDLDLSVTLFGDAIPAPIVVSPIADQRRFHLDGELATVRGASRAKAPVIVSRGSSVAVPELIAAASVPIWYQVFASDPGAKEQMRAAVAAGCKAVCLTVGVTPPANLSGTIAPKAARIDWAAVATLSAGSRVPVIVKGIATAEDAKTTLQHNVQGLIVSNYGGLLAPEAEALVLQLPAIVDAVRGRVPVIVDGSFRRGTDILKALAFGAQAVAVGRPVMWGLAAYGADGVQGVIEMLQTELARYMAMCGKSNLAALSREMLRVHGPQPPARPSSE